MSSYPVTSDLVAATLEAADAMAKAWAAGAWRLANDYSAIEGPYERYVAARAIASESTPLAVEREPLDERAPVLDANEQALVHRMSRELEANHHKEPWTNLTPDYLLSELYGHIEKMIASGSWEHAADVANLAAMYVDRRLSGETP